MENSRLGKLPPELRNMVYMSALRLPSPLQFTYKYGRMNHPDHPDGWIVERAGLREATALTRVCKQLRCETNGMFFALNDIKLNGAEAWRVSADLLLPTFSCFIGPAAAAAMKTVTIDARGISTGAELHGSIYSGQLLRPAKTIQAQAIELGWNAIMEFQVFFDLPTWLNIQHGGGSTSWGVDKIIGISIPITGSTSAMRQVLCDFDAAVKDGVSLVEAEYVRDLIDKCIRDLEEVTD